MQKQISADITGFVPGNSSLSATPMADAHCTYLYSLELDTMKQTQRPSTLAALTYPRLFSSLILVDPIIIRPGHFEECEDAYLVALALGALQRRDVWPSRYVRSNSLIFS